MNLDEAIQDLKDAFNRYHSLWFWERWFNTLDSQIARHAIRLALKRVEDFTHEATEERFWKEVEPMVAKAYDILGD